MLATDTQAGGRAGGRADGLRVAGCSEQVERGEWKTGGSRVNRAGGSGIGAIIENKRLFIVISKYNALLLASKKVTLAFITILKKQTLQRMPLTFVDKHSKHGPPNYAMSINPAEKVLTCVLAAYKTVTRVLRT